MMRLQTVLTLAPLLATVPAAAQTPDAPPTETATAPAEADPGSDPPAEMPADAPSAPPAAAEPAAEAPDGNAATPAPADAVEAPTEHAAEPAAEAETRVEPRRPGDDDIHLTMRWGMRIHLDPAYAVLGDDQNHLAVEIGLDVRVWRQLAVGFSFTGGGEQGTLYGSDTRWQDNSIFLSAVYRHRFHGLGLSTYGRIGPTVHWYRLTLGDDVGTAETFDDDPWQFGARAAAGVEFWPFSPDFIPYMGRFGIGVVLEGYYDQAFQSEWASGAVDPGEFDPTGPGWSLGLTGRF